MQISQPYKTSSLTLSDRIKQKILRSGPISFCDFMDMALYYPEIGYYTSPRDKIGVLGDYYTSPSLTPVFSNMIGVQIEEMWHILGEKEFTIVEYGAGTGSLCHNILKQLKNNEELYRKLSYCIIEKSPVMCNLEKKLLHEKVSWYNSLHDIPEPIDCIISNEVIDNFPVHQVVMQDELMEVFVDHNYGFKELLKPASKELKDYFTELSVTLPKGFRTEANLLAKEWITEIEKNLQKGFVITIDYGYPSLELYNEYRSSGTLICYNKHKISYHPYVNIGDQDITSHVNFSALSHWGSKAGLEFCGFTNQANFLIALGLEEYLYKIEENGKYKALSTHEKTLMLYALIVDMGRKFKVLIQQKGLIHPNLSGLKFSNKTFN